MMELKQISLKEANRFVAEHHRHNDIVDGHKFSLGAYKNDVLIGVSICGRPISRFLDDGKTLECRRLCTDGTRNACSFLYGASAREAKKRGYGKIITYTLMSEPGTSLIASGWTVDAEKCGYLSWNNSKRYRERHSQLSLFPKKEPPREYKRRWCKILKKTGGEP